MKNIKSSFLTENKPNFLLLLVGFLAVFIPLYPKLPLSDLLEGYIVRLRLEDLLIAFTFLIWLFQIFRRRLSFPKNTFTAFIIAYLFVGFLSSINAIFILKTVPLQKQHLFKLFLHYFRRLEYFSLYFIAYSAIKNKRDIYLLLTSSLTALVGVIIYGFGQKYLYWPAFSTMNREFSKGLRLYLTAHSRVMSTFAGHYDYAAYLMIALTILIPLFWFARRRTKIFLFPLILASYWSLILTASRTSWLGYILGITFAAIIALPLKNWRWVLKHWFSVIFFSFLIMFTLGDLSDRFLQVLNDPSTLAKFLPYSTGQIEAKIYQVKDLTYQIQAFKNKILSPLSHTPPENSLSDDELAKIAARSDQPPTPSKSQAQQLSKPLPPDVSPEDEILRQKLATQSAKKTATHSASSGGGYTENALKYGLSIAIRLDALWPRALAGFKRNPLLGSGYSTLVKTDPYEFTQAESTDNDYLRMLGETGLLGTLTFLSLPFFIIYYSLSLYRRLHSLFDKTLLIGTASATFALLINATYIDVFESSKIAYTYWLLAALVIRLVELSKQELKQP